MTTRRGFLLSAALGALLLALGRWRPARREHPARFWERVERGGG